MKPLSCFFFAETETTNDDSDNHLKEFNKKLNEKEADILKLQKDITEAEH